MFDFKTAKDLANHLKYLDSNKTAYNSYFKWKKYVNFNSLNDTYSHPFCDMCLQLNLEEYTGFKTSIIEDIDSYWNKSACKIPNFD